MSQESVPSSNRWLFNPLADMLLGCGVGYAILFVLLVVAGTTINTYFPYGMTPLIALFLSGPHYGSTLLRVYEHAESRHKYQFFSVYLTIVVWALFIVGVYHNFYGSLLVTLYLMWSPWHYMGQNYGIALMFLGRRGVFISSSAKRWLHVSFLASYALTLVAMQTLPSSSPTQGYVIYRIGMSDAVRDICYLVLGSLYIASTLYVVYSLLRRASLTDILPTLLLIATQALWFLVPLFAIRFHLMQSSVPLSADYAAYAFVWVAMGHAVQYLWITSYFAKRSTPPAIPSAFLGKALLAGALIWVIPALLFAPNVFGRLSYGGGLALLVAAAVNVHHFILDGAIWKLRDGPVARILLRNADAQKPVNPLPKVAPLMRWMALGSGIVCVVLYYSATVAAINFDRAAASGDTTRMLQISERLKWVGRDSAEIEIAVARQLLREGRMTVAKEHLQLANELARNDGNKQIEQEINSIAIE